MENLPFPSELFLVNGEHQGVEPEFLYKIKPIGTYGRIDVPEAYDVK